MIEKQPIIISSLVDKSQRCWIFSHRVPSVPPFLSPCPFRFGPGSHLKVHQLGPKRLWGLVGDSKTHEDNMMKTGKWYEMIYWYRKRKRTYVNTFSFQIQMRSQSNRFSGLPQWHYNIQKNGGTLTDYNPIYLAATNGWGRKRWQGQGGQTQAGASSQGGRVACQLQGAPDILETPMVSSCSYTHHFWYVRQINYIDYWHFNLISSSHIP